MKQTLPKFYKTIIVITFLIAVFFFLRWFDGVRPKYEIRETIELAYCNQRMCIMLEEINGMREVKYSEYYFCKVEDDWSSCYIQEKVRVQ